MRKILLALAVIALPAFAQPDPSADCVLNFNFTAAGNSATFNNTQANCVSWTLVYSSTGFTGLSLTFQSADGTTTPASFGAFAGSVVSGMDPNTSTTGAITVYKNGNVATPFVNVNLSMLMGTGRVIGVVKGWTTGHTGGSGTAGGGGSGGCSPLGGPGVVQASDGAGDCEATSITDDGSTVAITEPVIAPSLQVGTGTTSGFIVYPQGTAPSLSLSNAFTLYAPASIPSSYQWVLPAADAAGAIVSNGSATPGTLSIVGFSGTGNIAKTTNPAFTTPNLGTPSAVVLTHGTGLLIGGLTGLGTGVGTALAISIGSAGAPVLFNGALGTPTSGTLTNALGLPIGGLTGLGTGVATALAANVSGSGAICLATGSACAGVGGCSAVGSPTANVVLIDNGSGCPADSPVAINTTSGLAGGIQLPQGTAGTPLTNNILFQAPTAVTAFTVTLPGAAATGLWLGTNVAGVETITNAATGTGILTALAANVGATGAPVLLSGTLPTQFIIPVVSSTSGALSASTMKLNGTVHYPTTDSTTAVQFDASNATTVVMNLDTTNNRVGFGGVVAPARTIDVGTGSVGYQRLFGNGNNVYIFDDGPYVAMAGGAAISWAFGGSAGGTATSAICSAVSGVLTLSVLRTPCTAATALTLGSLATVTVLTSTLKTCTASTGTPWRAAVSDATAPAIGVVLTGGGTVFALVHCSLTTGTYLVDGI